MSIAQSLMEMVCEEARRHGLNPVRAIRVQVGDLAAVVPEALSFCFDMVSRDTVASGARLEIETIPAAARCPQCDIVFEVEDVIFLCPRCGDPTMDLISGRELTLLSLEGEHAGEDHDGNQSPRRSKHSGSE